MRRIVLAVALAAAAAGCRDASGREEVEKAVQAYIARTIEAYRKADVTIVDPLVGEQQGLKLTGLIGVKIDAGVALDAQLLHLEFTRVARDGETWVAETRERWYYRDLKLGTSEQVGPDSTDFYSMRYRFARKNGKLVLEDLEFLGEPVVGRTSAPVPTETRVLHGLPSAAEEAAAAAQAGGPPPGLSPTGPARSPPGGPPAPAGSPPPGHPPLPAPGRRP